MQERQCNVGHVQHLLQRPRWLLRSLVSLAHCHCLSISLAFACALSLSLSLPPPLSLLCSCICLTHSTTTHCHWNHTVQPRGSGPGMTHRTDRWETTFVATPRLEAGLGLTTREETPETPTITAAKASRHSSPTALITTLRTIGKQVGPDSASIHVFSFLFSFFFFSSLAVSFSRFPCCLESVYTLSLFN